MRIRDVMGETEWDSIAMGWLETVAGLASSFPVVPTTQRVHSTGKIPSGGRPPLNNLWLDPVGHSAELLYIRCARLARHLRLLRVIHYAVP